MKDATATARDRSPRLPPANPGLDGSASGLANYVSAGDGNDVIHGGNGNDFLNAWYGSDRIEGGAGNDQLYGDPDDRKLYADVLLGGTGRDLVDYQGHKKPLTVSLGTRTARQARTSAGSR